MTAKRTSKAQRLVDKTFESEEDYLRGLVHRSGATGRTSNEILRAVDIEGYKLILWDTGKRDRENYGHEYLGYRFIAPDGTVLFQGTDFGVPYGTDTTSDTVLRDLLGFLTLKPGDTDDEYFDKYTEQQMAFAQGDAERLSIYSMEPDEFENVDPAELKFKDLPGYEHEE
jgi:hypothetical protein